MADVSFQLEGLDALLVKLASVSDDVKRKGGRTALRKAAQLIANKAKEGADRIDDPVTGRSISSNIALRWNGKLFKRTGELGFRVGVLHGAVLRPDGSTEAKAPTPHWRLIEFGTSKIAAHPFMRPALANNIDAATSEFITAYSKAVDRAIRRAGGTA